MDLNHYRFRSTWRLDAPAADVYAALEDLGSYPAWWPEVRQVVPASEDSAEITCRSLLPYDLVFRSIEDRRDPETGVLQAKLVGDLDGFSRWTITSTGAGTTAVFDEEVDPTKPWLRRLAPVAWPAFRANHWLMMRHGEAGLRIHLAG